MVPNYFINEKTEPKPELKTLNKKMCRKDRTCVAYLFSPFGFIFITTTNDLDSFFKQTSWTCVSSHPTVLHTSRRNKDRTLSKLLLQLQLHRLG